VGRGLIGWKGGKAKRGELTQRSGKRLDRRTKNHDALKPKKLPQDRAPYDWGGKRCISGRETDQYGKERYPEGRQGGITAEFLRRMTRTWVKNEYIPQKKKRSEH